MAVVRDNRLRLHVRVGMHGSITQKHVGAFVQILSEQDGWLCHSPMPPMGAQIKPPLLEVDIYYWEVIAISLLLLYSQEERK